MYTANDTEIGLHLDVIKAILWSTIIHQYGQPSHVSRASFAIEQTQQGILPITHVFDAPVFCGHRVFDGSTHRDWVLMPLGEDPLLQHPGGFPVPDHVLDRLRMIYEAGIDFDTLFIAHEVPRGTVHTNQPLLLDIVLPPPSPKTSQLSQTLGMFASVLWTFASLPILLVAGVGLGITHLATRIAGTADPILFGVVLDENSTFVPGKLGSWFYLGHWNYSEEQS